MKNEILRMEDTGSHCSNCPLTSGLLPSNSKTSANSIVAQIKPKEHHKQCELCTTRARYRQGKEFKAVKVYTVNQESRHLILQNIPAVNLGNELKKLCQTFGNVESFHLVPNYPAFEEFTETFYVKYTSLSEGRFAKKKLDNRSFYGGLIHIFYAPELESVDECREKLNQRKEYVKRYVDPYTLAESKKKKNLKGSPSTSICANKRAEESKQQILLSSTSVAAREKEEKAKHLQSYLWKLEKGQKNMREEQSSSRSSSSSSVCKSEKAQIAPQQWARTGQKTTFANQSSISAPTTKTAKEFGKDIRIQEAFPNSTAGTSYSASSSFSTSSTTCDDDTTMQSTSRTDATLSAHTSTISATTAVSSVTTSFFDQTSNTSKDQVLFKPRQTYNYVKPKPLSATRIVFHYNKANKKKMEEDSPEDDTTTSTTAAAAANKRRKEDEDRDLLLLQGKK